MAFIKVDGGVPVFIRTANIQESSRMVCFITIGFIAKNHKHISRSFINYIKLVGRLIQLKNKFSWGSLLRGLSKYIGNSYG